MSRIGFWIDTIQMIPNPIHKKKFRTCPLDNVLKLMTTNSSLAASGRYLLAFT